MGKKGGSKSKNTPKPTAQEKALAKSAKKKFELYKRVYRPLHKELLEKTAASPAKRAQARGIVGADIAQGAKGDSGTTLGLGLAGGFSGDSSKNILARAKRSQATGSVKASGSARATSGVDTRELQGKVNFARIGLGIAGQTLQSQTQLARNATALALEDAANDTSTAQNMMMGLGAFMGAASPMGGGPQQPKTVGTTSSGMGTGGTFNYVNNQNGFVGGF